MSRLKFPSSRSLCKAYGRAADTNIDPLVGQYDVLHMEVDVGDVAFDGSNAPVSTAPLPGSVVIFIAGGRKNGSFDLRVRRVRYLHLSTT